MRRVADLAVLALLYRQVHWVYREGKKKIMTYAGLEPAIS